MKHKEIIDQLQQRVDDALDSVEAIQGPEFRNLLAHVMACSQVMRLMHAIMDEYDADLVRRAGEQAAMVLSKGSSMLADAYNIDESKVQELMKWVETLDGHVVNAMKEANKHD